MFLFLLASLFSLVLLYVVLEQRECLHHQRMLNRKLKQDLLLLQTRRIRNSNVAVVDFQTRQVLR